WRAMRSGYLTVSELRELEGVLWGNTKQTGLVRVTVEVEKEPVVKPVDKRGMKKRAKTSLGLFYHSYGMDEDEARRRPVAWPGGSWRVQIEARGGPLGEHGRITAERAMQQAEGALRLLSFLGGVGAKSRKGFGC